MPKVSHTGNTVWEDSVQAEVQYGTFGPHLFLGRHCEDLQWQLSSRLGIPEVWVGMPRCCTAAQLQCKQQHMSSCPDHCRRRGPQATGHRPGGPESSALLPGLVLAPKCCFRVNGGAGQTDRLLNSSLTLRSCSCVAGVLRLAPPQPRANLSSNLNGSARTVPL